MRATDPYEGAGRVKTSVRILVPLWERLGRCAHAADEMGSRTSRQEVIEALVHFHASEDPQEADRLIRRYRMARLGSEPGPDGGEGPAVT